jgi:hypothetical protein
MDPEDLQTEIHDILLSAEAWVGGRPGIMNHHHEGELCAYMRGRGWLGPKGGLTRKGAAEARKVQREYYGS